MLYLVDYIVGVFGEIGKVGIDCSIYVFGTVIDVFAVFGILFFQFVAVFGKGNGFVGVSDDIDIGCY